MAVIGDDRSPHQWFGRSEFEPHPSDRDLVLPLQVVVRPSVERLPFDSGGNLKPEPPPDVFSAPDVVDLPWTRRRGDEWTTPDFRAVVLAWLRGFFAERRHLRLVGWDVAEVATAPMSAIRLPQSAHYLRVGVVQRRRDARVRVEAAIDFAPSLRVSPHAEARLALLAAAIDVQLLTIM